MTSGQANFDIDPTIFDDIDFGDFTSFDWNEVDNYEQEALNVLASDGLFLDESDQGKSSHGKKVLKHKRGEDAVVPVEDYGYDNAAVYKVSKPNHMGKLAPHVDSLAEVFESDKSPSGATDKESTRKAVANRFFQALNLGDINALANVIQEDFWDLCYISTPDLPEPAVRKCRVMIYFSLLFETFPDAVWKFSNQLLDNDTLSATFMFRGTRVLDYSLDDLFQYVSSKAMKHQNYLENSVFCEFVVNNISEFCQTQKDSVNFVVNSNNSDELSSQPSSTCSLKSPRSDSGFTTSDVSSDEKWATSPDAFAQFSASAKSIHSKANKAILEGTVKYSRKMDLVFSEANQIIRVVVTSS